MATAACPANGNASYGLKSRHDTKSESGCVWWAWALFLPIRRRIKRKKTEKYGGRIMLRPLRKPSLHWTSGFDSYSPLMPQRSLLRSSWLNRFFLSLLYSQVRRGSSYLIIHHAPLSWRGGGETKKRNTTLCTIPCNVLLIGTFTLRCKNYGGGQKKRNKTLSRHPLATPGIFYNFPPPEIHAAQFICCSPTKIDCFYMWLIFGGVEMWLIFGVRLLTTWYIM